MPAAQSVDPTPVENAPNAPYVHVWLSAPMTRSPAATIPCSGRRACSMPMLPTSKKWTISCFFANSRHTLHCSALLMSLFGAKWSRTKATFSWSNTRSMPAFSSSRMETGPVISFASARSISASMSCPASTDSSPACAARIFCVMVIPMVIPTFLVSFIGVR